MTEEDIKKQRSTNDLYNFLAEELYEKTKDISLPDYDLYIRRLRDLPGCLWSLGSIYELDVSITLDDLGWHFSNHHHMPMAMETLSALEYINLNKEASIFRQAIEISQKYWVELGSEEFVEWYGKSEMEKLMSPLNDQMWALDEKEGLLDKYVRYVQGNARTTVNRKNA